MSQTTELTPLEADTRPLTFLALDGDQDATVGEAHTRHRCDVRGLGAGRARYQKEGLVQDLDTGRTWRLTADEGPAMRGPDCAPSPLMHWIGGLHGEMVSKIADAAHDRGLDESQFHVTVSQGFGSAGSFAKGEAAAVVRDQQCHVEYVGDASEQTLNEVLAEAFTASKAVAVSMSATHSTFSLTTNGRPSALPDFPPSPTLEVDPFLRHAASPALASIEAVRDLASRRTRDQTEKIVLSDDQSGTVTWRIQAEGSFDPRAGTITSVTSFPQAVETEWVLISDPTGVRAPHPMAYYALGTAFCFHTQMCRYSDVRRIGIESPRLAQLSDVSGSNSVDGPSLLLDTQIYLNGSTSEETASSLVGMAAKTCYAHAAIATEVKPQTRLLLSDA